MKFVIFSNFNGMLQLQGSLTSTLLYKSGTDLLLYVGVDASLYSGILLRFFILEYFFVICVVSLPQ